MRRTQIVTAAASLAILVILAVAVVLPQGARVQEREAEVSAAEADLTALEAEVEELERFAASGEAQLASEEIAAKIPTEADLPGLLGLLRAAAADAGVVITALTPGNPSPSLNAPASVIPVSITATGGYFELARFIFQLETLERLSKVTSVSLTSSGDVGGGQLTLQASAQVFTTDTNAGPGSDPAPGEALG